MADQLPGPATQFPGILQTTSRWYDYFRCRACGKDFSDCPSCDKPLVGTREKGVDTAIVTDLLSLAWENAYEIAILVTSDADMIPGVERLQEKGFKVINAAWAGRGYQLAQVCWASFNLLEVADQFTR